MPCAHSTEQLLWDVTKRKTADRSQLSPVLTALCDIALVSATANNT